MSRVHLNVPSIACEGCARSIKQALSRLAGVQQVDVNVAAKTVDVEFDSAKTTESEIRQCIEAAGYSVES